MLTFASCTGEKQPVDANTSQTTLQSQTTDEVGSEIISEDKTSDNGVTKVGETTKISETAKTEITKTGDTAKPTTNSVAKKPSTKAEIVAYYTQAANAVKVDKPGYKGTETPSIGVIEIPGRSRIQSFVKRIIAFMPMDPVETSVAKGKSHNDLPVKGQSWASKLEVSSVKSATCKENGNVYEIKIMMNDEVLNDLPATATSTKHGKVFSVLTAPEVYEQTDKFKALATIKAFKPTYTGSYIECKINKTTGKMISATYYFNTRAIIEAKAFLLGGDITAIVPFAITIKQTYLVNN